MPGLQQPLDGAQGWGRCSPACRLSKPSHDRHMTPSVPSNPQGGCTDCHCARREDHSGHFMHPLEPQGAQMAPAGGSKVPARLFEWWSLVTQPCTQSSATFCRMPRRGGSRAASHSDHAVPEACFLLFTNCSHQGCSGSMERVGKAVPPPSCCS